MGVIVVFCPKCGEEVEASWNFCPSCKHNLDGMGEKRDIKAVETEKTEDKSSAFYEESHAVVIGVNEYKKVRSLNSSVADAEAVEEVLLNFGFPEENITKLVNEQATRQNIQDTLKVEMRERCGEEDRLLVYFAGHGQDYELSEDERVGYLLPVDADPDYLPSRGISMEEVKKWNRHIPAKHILYVIDSCYSGLAATRSTGLPPDRDDYLKEIGRRKVRQIITAGSGDEKALEKGGHGVFTRTFLRAIKGDADLHGKGVITGFDLGNYLNLNSESKLA